jgi:methylmalonyl-CoA mutase C-terminal domain/subunit
MSTQRIIRVLLAKVGLDGHDRGIKLVARHLMEAGMEVIYTGLRATPEDIAAAVAQEDAQVLGLSFLAGDHMVLVPKVMQCLKSRGVEDVLVLMGGIVLPQQLAELGRMGVAQVFQPGTPLEHISQFIRSNIDRNTQKEPS